MSTAAAAADAATGADHATGAGRTCPLGYRYRPEVFARAADAAPEVLYLVGGLYGNEAALASVLSLFERERGSKRLLFNGDFHWFDVDPAAFRRITEQVLSFDALRGNVETELAADAAGSDDAGCGCGYPGWVSDEVVERSNRIMRRLRGTARQSPDLCERLAALPMWRRIDVGPLRLGIVHGDAESLAGWGFAQEHLRDRAHRAKVHAWFDAAQVDAFACTHTCLPLFHTLERTGERPRFVLNNGASGMPNFLGDTAGLLTRVAVHPFAGPQRRFGLVHEGVHLDAIAIDHDASAWRAEFLKHWPAGSDAHLSYWDRIVAGPQYHGDEAVLHSTD